MEDKQLTTHESIDLIARMIETTRRNFSNNGGAMFLIWGYTTVVVTAAVMGLLLLTRNYGVMWLWWALPLAGGALTWIHYRKNPRSVNTHLDKTIGYIWTVAGITSVVCAVFVFAASAIVGKPMINILFTIALLIGMATTITGLIIRFRPTVAGGFAGIALSFVIPFFENIWQFPIFAAIFLIAQVIPGHMLDRACRRQTPERR